ncbi:hypothetical protein C2S52_010274 [Perilla frutescens var. hirtella]|nr:hypothetical protein C2S52_010274 [Perilla frutescens var. hirtella]
MGQPSPMNGGDGIYSYTKNSSLQRNGASVVNDAMKEALIDNLDIKRLLSGSTTFTIADLGCSVGPNTFMAMQTIIQTVVEHKASEGLLEFQVLFNDQIGNDFNTLFASLPHRRNYFAAAVPGSFYGRLFPSSSIHIAYSSYALQWLSKLPEELQVKDSPAWNAGKIHYMGASDAVLKAYTDQFDEDMGIFLGARAEEIVPGGMIVVVIPSVPEGCVIEHGTSIVGSFLESIFMDMVNEGVVEQEEVDSFNFPSVSPSMKDMRRVVEKNGCFEIVRMELGEAELPSNGDGEVDAERVLVLYRAASEKTFANHFGNEIVDQLYVRAIQKKLKYTQNLHSFGVKTSTQLFAALKRK